MIELNYKIYSPYPKSINDLQFQYGIPVKNLSYQLEIPEYYDFKTQSKGYYYIPLKKSSKNGRIGTSTRFLINVLSFDQTNIPALRDDEPFTGSISNYRGGVSFELSSTNFLSIGGGVNYYTTTWEDVSRQIYKTSSFGDEIDKENYYKDDLTPVLAQTKSDVEKVYAVFNL